MRTLLSVTAIVAIGCGTIAPGDPGSKVPKVHRPSAMMCDPTRPPITPGMSDGGVSNDGGVPDVCNVDADCTKGTNGRCGYNRIGKICSYDTCTTDADCSGGVCVCRTSSTDTSPNHCVGNGQTTGACKLDSDCGTNGYCSPSFGSCGNYGGVVGYFCHTKDDACTNDSDCTEGGPGFCMFETTAKKWQCSYQFCAG